MRTKPKQNEVNASNTSGGTKPHTEKKKTAQKQALADRMSPTATKGKQQNTTIHNATG